MITSPQQGQNRETSSVKGKAVHLLAWWAPKLATPALVLVVGVLLIVGLGVAQRLGFISADGGATVDTGADSQQVFTCPMHPQIRQPSPGRCPICGMALVLASSSGDSDLNDLSIRIEPAQRRLANIETVDVKSEVVSAKIETVGSIAIDESRMATISAYIDGRLERLFADYTGVEVAKGDHLAVIYSPQLYSAQVEYIESRKSQLNSSSTLEAVRQAQQKLVENSRQRLTELGLQKEQITELETSGKPQSRLTIYSPIGGTVVEKLAVEGKYVKAGEPIYRIAELSTVWLMLELFPEGAARVRFGQKVVASLQSLPGKTFEGRIAFIDPTVNAMKRSVGVRVEFSNDDGNLRPGDYADATIYVPLGATGETYDADLAGKWISPMHPQIIRDSAGECPICGMDLVPTSGYGFSKTPIEQPKSITVPRSALLMAGKSSVVYIEEEPGRFELKPVTVGPILRDRVVILDGLKEGQKVATSGNFLIDSQMQLAGKPSVIDPSRAIAAKKNRNKPLEFSEIDVAAVEGEAGKKLESMYDAYFRIQKTLANDQKPSEADAVSLHALSQQLSKDEALSEVARAELTVVAEKSEHLHHLDLAKARLEAFRPVSHAIVKLAAMIRGQQASQEFHHMYCPMVTGGAGDWLQSDDELINPYKGSEMLNCGSEANLFPQSGRRETAKPTQERADASNRLSEESP